MSKKKKKKQNTTRERIKRKIINIKKEINKKETSYIDAKSFKKRQNSKNIDERKYQ